MKILRYTIDEETYGGLLFDEDGKTFCHTLEPLKEAIPCGEYELAVRHSPKFKRDTLWIQGVPDRDFILIHSGNKIEDSDGCILVGYIANLQDKLISVSRKAEDALLFKYRMSLNLGKKFKVTISEI